MRGVAPVAVEMAMLFFLPRRIALTLIFRRAKTRAILRRGLLLPGTRLALAVLSQIDDVAHRPPTAFLPTAYCLSSSFLTGILPFGPGRGLVLRLRSALDGLLPGLLRLGFIGGRHDRLGLIQCRSDRRQRLRLDRRRIAGLAKGRCRGGRTSLSLGVVGQKPFLALADLLLELALLLLELSQGLRLGANLRQTRCLLQALLFVDGAALLLDLATRRGFGDKPGLATCFGGRGISGLAAQRALGELDRLVAGKGLLLGKDAFLLALQFLELVDALAQCPDRDAGFEAAYVIARLQRRDRPAPGDLEGGFARQLGQRQHGADIAFAGGGVEHQLEPASDLLAGDLHRLARHDATIHGDAGAATRETKIAGAQHALDELIDLGRRLGCLEAAGEGNRVDAAQNARRQGERAGAVHGGEKPANAQAGGSEFGGKPGLALQGRPAVLGEKQRCQLGVEIDRAIDAVTLAVAGDGGIEGRALAGQRLARELE